MLGRLFSLAAVVAVGVVNAGTVIWDGRFKYVFSDMVRIGDGGTGVLMRMCDSDYTTATDINTWSWANQVGSYQW